MSSGSISSKHILLSFPVLGYALYINGCVTSPVLRLQVDELEASAKRLRDRCSNLLNSAKKYRDALGTMLEAQQSFGSALQEFGGGTDDESLQIGKQIP